MEDEMRTQILKAVGAASVLGAAVLLSATVQAADVRANVPFSFQVNQKVLTPGTYTISTNGSTMLVRGLNSGAAVLGLAIESAKASSPKLVFHRYGDEYILREVWTGGGSGRKLPESRRERELAGQRGGAATASLQRVEIPLL
jgi:hypothetical protein